MSININIENINFINMNINFLEKYLKYKRKYLNLKMSAGAYQEEQTVYEPVKIDMEPHYLTIGNCVKELIEFSFELYSKIIEFGNPTTIICGGQSPSYYCLAMLNFKIYNPELVDIVILPHSKGGVQSFNQYQENVKYCERLIEKGIEVKENVIIIDGVHSGTGILALESALKHCFPYIKLKKFAINADRGISKIKVDQEFFLPCEPRFSDVFPRLINSYHPKDFNSSILFINRFINIESNLIAKMIISVASTFPEVNVEDTLWYQLNNNIPDELIVKKNMEDEKQQKLKIQEMERGKYFKPIILENPKRYKCPICQSVTGTAAPLNPQDISLFSHNWDCPNKFKIPIE